MCANFRNLFVGIDTLVSLDDGTSIIPINFDNGATTPPLKCALNAIIKNAQTYGPIARGSGQKGELCTQKYEEGRNIILDFFNLKDNPKYTVVYTKTTTESLNILADILIKEKSDKILTTRMEHHANDLPWRHSATVEYVEVDKNGRVTLESIEKKLIENKGSIKFVSITGASNVTGYMNDIHSIAALSHKYGAKIIVDAAQLVAHKKIDMNGNNPGEEIDFLVFSAHKAYAPFGCGAIVGLIDYLRTDNPLLTGGGCVDAVFDSEVIYNAPPTLLEAGSPNFLGIMAMIRSLNELQKIGFDKIYSHEKEIKDYIISELKNIPNVILYGDVKNTEDRLGVITFNLKNMKHYDVSKKLANEYGIATRYNKFCAHTYVYRLLGVDDDNAYEEYVKDKIDSVTSDNGLIRVSLGLYNTLDEAKTFINAIKDLSQY